MTARHPVPGGRRLPPVRPLHTESRPRPPRPELFICCEGKNTEPHYLEGFAARHGVLLKRNLHIIAPCGVPDSVLQRAIRQQKDKKYEYRKTKEEFTVWIVMDVDEHANAIPGILKKAQEAGINVALSNPCIEIWALYHFDPPPTAELHRHAAQSRLEKRMPSYNKDRGKLFDLELLLPEYAVAVQRAQRAMENAADDPFPNPSTTLYALLEEIRKMGRRDPATS